MKIKRFIKNVISLIFIYLIIVNFIKWIAVPYYWPLELYELKNQQILNQENSYNNIIFGSSTVYRHYNIELIENELGENDWYNFGIPGIREFERNYLLRNLIHDLPHDRSIKIFIIEERKDYINKLNLNTPENKYYLTPKYWLLISKNLLKEKQWTQLYYYTISFIENVFMIGEANSIIKYYTDYLNYENEEIIKNKGFYSLEEELCLQPNSFLFRRNKEFIATGFENSVAKEPTPIEIEKIKLSSLGISEKFNNITIYFVSGKPVPISKDFYFDNFHYNNRGSDLFSKNFCESYKVNFISSNK